MKTLQTIAALLATAILCIALVSCDRKPSKDDTSSSETMNEEALSTFESADISTTGKPETEEELTTITSNTLPHQGTTVVSTTAVSPTKVTTTAPSTTKPVVTTTVPSTTVPSTTLVTTTVPDITTTAPTISTQTTTTPPVTERPTDIVTDSGDMDSEQTVISIVNRYRIAEGLGELSYSPELSAAANIRAKELAVNFSSMRPDGSLWYTVVGYLVGENPAKGQASAADVMNYWMNSEGCKKNILTPQYTKIGVGCYYDSATDTYYWVQLFV